MLEYEAHVSIEANPFIGLESIGFDIGGVEEEVAIVYDEQWHAALACIAVERGADDPPDRQGLIDQEPCWPELPRTVTITITCARLPAGLREAQIPQLAQLEVPQHWTKGRRRSDEICRQEGQRARGT